MSYFSFNNITGGYGDTHVIFDASAKIDQGQVLGVFGRNGVGKTSLARLLVGHLLPVCGQVQLNKQNIGRLPVFSRRHHGLGYLPQTQMVFDSLTVADNLEINGRPKDLDRYLDRFSWLKDRYRQKAGTMSGGERKILGFVRAMTENTSVVILDEPTEGVQTENIELMQKCIVELKSTGTAFVLIEQHINFLCKVADLFLGIDCGHTIHYDTAENTPQKKILKLLTV